MLQTWTDNQVMVSHIHIFTREDRLDMSMTIRCSEGRRKFYFKNVSSLAISSITCPIQIAGFQVCDHKEDGWYASERYEVLDYEDGRIHFFCSEFMTFILTDDT